MKLGRFHEEYGIPFRSVDICAHIGSLKSIFLGGPELSSSIGVRVSGTVGPVSGRCHEVVTAAGLRNLAFVDASAAGDVSKEEKPTELASQLQQKARTISVDRSDVQHVDFPVLPILTPSNILQVVRCILIYLWNSGHVSSTTTRCSSSFDTRSDLRRTFVNMNASFR